jgi:hypothetical protein
MKKRDRAELKRYIRWIANEMELRDWTIFLAGESCENENLATCALVFGQKYATIRVCKDFRTLDADQQRKTVVHELLHCHWHAAWEMVDRDLEKALGAQADLLFSAGFNRNAEHALDATAAALAKHLPRIDWPEAKAKKRAHRCAPMNTVHTYPVNDLVDHVTDGSKCHCQPWIEFVDGGQCVHHHSLDGREHFEHNHDREACPLCSSPESPHGRAA